MSCPDRYVKTDSLDKSEIVKAECDVNKINNKAPDTSWEIKKIGQIDGVR